MTSTSPVKATDPIFTPANIVTMVRIALVPLFFFIAVAPWASWADGEESRFLLAGLMPLVAAGVFALLALTDGLDGHLARSRGEVTTLGIFLDPLADKILVSAALIALVELGSLPAWAALVVVAREFLVSALRMAALSRGLVIAASPLGKVKTFTQILAVLAFILKGSSFVVGLAWSSYLVVEVTAWTLMAAALVMTLVSLADYLRRLVGAVGAASPSEQWYPRVDRTDRRLVGAVGAASPAGLAAPVSDADGSQATQAAKALVGHARAKGLWLATAESCTGGLLAAALTSVPGASDVFVGSVVSYANEVKHTVLGVPTHVLEVEGAVSEKTACAMARGALDALGADVAASVTGIAGPGGGSDEKPVGTVWLGIAMRKGVVAHDGEPSVTPLRDEGPALAYAEACCFTGSRDEIRAQAVSRALRLLDTAIADSCSRGAA
ncbi:MAG: CDP-diacylglycerol--glycerol-3-phosphate 3-phosphatidyltransferase [Coriobacteriales bacterium]|jgi:CDP-diacylglycerol--glycerol-3-phosphate 3-phosphatidyltransferase|nr:CDP-diacylglycerol--glycerol-3-phosphate 3-phosphatidyltransferase [Coriobacteriales bacterium]